MAKRHESNTSSQPATTQDPLPAVSTSGNGSSFTDKALTVAAVGVAAALIEVDLIPGMLLGVAAMLAPNLLPKVGNGLRPLIKEAVRAGYNATSKARETMAEAGEQFQDIVAEVKAEQHPVAGDHPHASAETAEPA